MLSLTIDFNTAAPWERNFLFSHLKKQYKEILISLTIDINTTEPSERNFLISYLKKNKQYKEILNYYLSNSKNYYENNYINELIKYTKANYDQILPNYLEEIEAGNTTAMYCLGRYYLEEIKDGYRQSKLDVAIKNYINNLAYKYIKQSVDAGDFAGSFYLGLMYENGNGCEKDLKKALDLITLSANKNCHKAIDHLKSYSDKYIPILKEYPELWLSVIKCNGSLLKHIDNQTPEICMAAVKQDGCSLLDVKEQTPEICMSAVQQNGGALKYVKEQTPEICMAAVQQNGRALKYVRKQTAIIINTAIANYDKSYHYINWSYRLKSLCPNLSFNLGFHSYTPIKTD